MGKFNVGIGLYNDKLDVYTIKNGKYLKLNDQNCENSDILEKLKLIKRNCKRYFNTEEEIGVVLSLQDKIEEEVKEKIKDLIKLSGFIIKKEIKESTSIILAYGLENVDEPIFIVDTNPKNSTINLLDINNNIDITVDLNIDINLDSDLEYKNVISLIKDKIKSICNEINLSLKYKVVLIGGLSENKAFNKIINNEMPDIYNYRKELLAKGASIEADDKSCSIIKYKEEKYVKKEKESIDLANFYYINKDFDRAKELLIEKLNMYGEYDLEYVNSLICLLDIYLTERDLDKAYSINNRILKQDISDKQILDKYENVINKNGSELIAVQKRNIRIFKYEILNILDGGFEYDIETNNSILDYEKNLYKNTSILDLDKESLDYMEIVEEIERLNKIIESNNISVFKCIKAKLEDINNQLAY